MTATPWSFHCLLWKLLSTVRAAFKRLFNRILRWSSILMLFLLLSPPPPAKWLSSDVKMDAVGDRGWKEVGCQMVWFSNAIWIQDSPAIWIPDKWAPPWFLKYWSSFRMVGLIYQPFEYQTIWNPNFKKFFIQMVGIQIPTTVLVWYSNDEDY